MQFLSGCTANTKTLTCTSETKSGVISPSKNKNMIDYDGNDVKKTNSNLLIIKTIILME